MQAARLKLLSWGLALAGAALLAFLILHQQSGAVSGSLGSQTITPIAGLGGAFNLTNQRNERVTEKTFLGKPTLYFFGFTHCPDTCPTTLYDLTNHLKELGSNADKLNVVFVTIDPERDTVKALKDYMTAFDPRMVALTGSVAEISAMTKAYRVFNKKVPLKGGGYTFNHTATVFAADSQGRVVMLIDFQEAPEMVRVKLKRLISENQ
jgi:protein SCO1/2